MTKTHSPRHYAHSHFIERTSKGNSKSTSKSKNLSSSCNRLTIHLVYSCATIEAISTSTWRSALGPVTYSTVKYVFALAKTDTEQRHHDKINPKRPTWRILLVMTLPKREQIGLSEATSFIIKPLRGRFTSTHTWQYPLCELSTRA